MNLPQKNCCPNQGLTDPNCGQNEVLQHFLLTIKLIFHISWLHRISFTYNPTASFFMYRIVEWPWIEFRMRPMLFKKSSWNLFYSDAVGLPVKLAYYLLFHPYIFLRKASGGTGIEYKLLECECVQQKL